MEGFIDAGFEAYGSQGFRGFRCSWKGACVPETDLKNLRLRVSRHSGLSERNSVSWVQNDDLMQDSVTLKKNTARL